MSYTSTQFDKAVALMWVALFGGSVELLSGSG